LIVPGTVFAPVVCADFFPGVGKVMLGGEEAHLERP